MKAMVTGASSGIGKEIAIYLSELGCELILVAKDKEKLEKVIPLLKGPAKLIVIDLANEKKIKDLYMIIKNEDIDILVNNAGFGLLASYEQADLLKELSMIDVNIKAVHILTRMLLKDFTKRNSGYILNVSSAASFLKGGPLMSTYYATKAYVSSFTLATYQELKKNKSKVHVALLCPGPVNTNFDDVAGVKFRIKGLDARYVARYTINKMFKNKKLVIIPGTSTKIGLFLTRFLPTKLTLKIVYHIQKKKG